MGGVTTRSNSNQRRTTLPSGLIRPKSEGTIRAKKTKFRGLLLRMVLNLGSGSKVGNKGLNQKDVN